MKKTKLQVLTLTLVLVLAAGTLSACASKNSGTPQPAETGRTGEAEGKQPAETGQAEEEQPAETTQNAQADGTFEPSLFTVEGGTGRVTITCPEVVVTDGAAQARLEFSSPHYEWVQADGVQYEPENAQEDRKNSVFTIPVRLDEEMKISGLTTAMSEPHEIEYTIFISLTQEAPSSGGTAAPAEGAAVDSGKLGSSAKEQEEISEEEYAQKPGKSASAGESEPPVLPGLVCTSAMETSYAETFEIYTYQGEDSASDDAPSAQYRLIDVHDSGQYLMLPETDPSSQEGKQEQARQEEIVKNLPPQITVLRAPLDDLYVAATSSMALFDAAGAIGQVKLTGTKADGWYIEAPKKALQDGSMTYAGKYSAPDYELLASSGCDLAVESMMILHTPEVKEKLEELGIPVFIDTSSNESHPLGRTEWVRLYGVLTGHEAEAEAFFEKQKQQLADADSYTDTGETVAFFSISSNGNVIVRATDDYIPRMIGLAGGNYIFEDLLNESGNSASVRLSMEDFYNTARDADYLIYNATIEKPVGSIAELCGQSSLLTDFSAVQSGNVWQVRRSLYQSPDIAAQMIADIHGMLTGGDPSGMVFLEKLE